MTIKATATNGARERVSAAALEDVELTTMGGCTKANGSTPEASVTIMLTFANGRKLPIRMSTDDATHLIARLMQSLGAALGNELKWTVSAVREAA